MGLQLRISNFHGVKGDREVGIGRIEINNIVGTLGRNALQNIDRVVAMRIDDRKTVWAKDVADGQQLQKTGLTDTGLSDDVQVPPPVGARQAEHGVAAAEVGVADGADVVTIARADDR